MIPPGVVESVATTRLNCAERGSLDETTNKTTSSDFFCRKQKKQVNKFAGIADRLDGLQYEL